MLAQITNTALAGNIFYTVQRGVRLNKVQYAQDESSESLDEEAYQRLVAEKAARKAVRDEQHRIRYAETRIKELQASSPLF